jgi:zinc protease
MAFMGESPATHRSARLYRALVETEWTVSAHSSFQFSLDPGLFTIRAVLRADRTLDEVEPRLLAELQRLVDEPPDAAEVARTARQVRAQLAYGRESSTDQAYWLGTLTLADQPQRLDTLLEEVASVQPADVQRVAARYLIPERRTIGWFVPTETAPPPPFAVSSPAAVEETGDRGTAGRGDGELGSQGDEETEGQGNIETRRPSRAVDPETRTPCPLPAAAIFRQVLPGGTVLLVRPNHAHPLAAIAGYVRAGSLHDPIGQEGLARATAAMLARGTASRSFHEIHELIEGLGAGLEFGGRTYNTYFKGQALAEDVPTLLKLLVEMLRTPSFPETEWQRLRGEMLTRLRYLEDNPGYVANRSFHELLYPAEHPLRRRFEGTVESLGSLAVADLAAFHERHVHAANLVVAISGDIEPVQITERLTDLLADWAPRAILERPEVPAIPRPAEVRRVAQAIPGKRQANLVLGFPGPARTAPDHYAALLGNIVLGELGMMGRLGASLRDQQGLAYSVTSTLESGPDTGLWTVRAGTAPAQMEPTIAGIQAEIARFLAQGPTPEEHADTVSYLTGHLPLALETNGGVANHLLAIERFDLGLDYVERYPEILNGITRAAVVETARRYLSADEYVLAMAGPIG